MPSEAAVNAGRWNSRRSSIGAAAVSSRAAKAPSATSATAKAVNVAPDAQPCSGASMIA